VSQLGISASKNKGQTQRLFSAMAARSILPAMKNRTHFTHRIDIWDDAGENIPACMTKELFW
jgi:hypothetical protein